MPSLLKTGEIQGVRSTPSMLSKAAPILPILESLRGSRLKETCSGFNPWRARQFSTNSLSQLLD